MSLLETVHLSHVPENIPVHVALYKYLKNASFLREQLLTGNAEFQYAFIDASTVGIQAQIARSRVLIYRLDYIETTHPCGGV